MMILYGFGVIMNAIAGSNPLSGPFLSNSISKRCKIFVANKNNESRAKLSPKITIIKKLQEFVFAK